MYGVGHGGQAWLMEGIMGTEKPQLSEELGLALLVCDSGLQASGGCVFAGDFDYVTGRASEG